MMPRSARLVAALVEVVEVLCRRELNGLEVLLGGEAADNERQVVWRARRRPCSSKFSQHYLRARNLLIGANTT